MKTLHYSLLITALVLCSNLFAQKNLERLMASRGEYFFTLTVSQPDEIQAISELCSVDATDGTTVVCYANQNQYDNLLKQGYRPQLQTPPSMLEEPIMFDPQRGEYEWDAYLTYEQYEAMMQQSATEHPERCTYFELGTLDSGRKLMFCRINNGQPDGKPRFLYTSTMHGDELTGMILMLRLIDELCTSNEPRILNLINNLDIFICPNTNPDGTYYGGNHTVWGATRKNANEVELNRHYPDFVAGPHPDGEWCYQNETQWLMNLAQDHKFTMAANFHTGSEVVNYPWDNFTQLSADDAWWEMVSRQYADLVHEACYATDSTYMTNFNDGIVRGCLWYMISGGRQDYMNYYQQCREVTIECSRTYTPNASLLPMYWEYNHNSILSYMEQCLNGIHGRVTDAETGEPIEVTVSIAGHDHHGSEVSSHLPAGDYHRPIKGGTYDVTYSAYGYLPQTITLSVNDNEAITQDVQLVPDPDNTALFADFNADREMLTTGKPVRFHEACKGRRIVNWAWQFPGGTPSESNERNPYIVYETAGTYDVTLTITDADGQTATITQEQLMDVYTPYPVVDGDLVMDEGQGLLLPSGGDCGHYGNNENYRLTLRPNATGKKLSVNFLKFMTQPQSDVLRVYDGTTTNAPLIGSFSGSQTPDSIMATNAEGALTFAFTSDARNTYYGWIATINSIGGEAVEDNETVRFKVYPNPTNTSFNIEVSCDFNYCLFNSLGQMVAEDHLDGGTHQIHTENLSQGIYFLHINCASGNFVEKVVIE